jgi:aminoglycoside phosphotransferase
VLTADPGVPQRDDLLSEATMTRALGRRAERVYAKYRVGESLRVVYRTGAMHVAARSYREGASAAAYDRALASAVPAPEPPVRHLAALDAVLWTFPNDRKIAALPLLVPGSQALSRMLGRSCSATRLVAYAAERAASAECRDTRGRVCAYVKVHAGDGAARERRALDALAGAPVPRVLAASEQAVAVEPVPGRRLDTLAPRELTGALRALGAALAAVHEAVPPAEPRFARLDRDRLARAAAVIARARPDAGRPAERMLAALQERPAAEPDVYLHGDANLRNAILAGGRVTLLDLEDAAGGPAAADLGQVLAGLRTARVLCRLSPAGEATLAAALLAGYGSPPDGASLRWHTAASMLARVALPAVSRVRAPLLPHLVRLLEEALP